MTSPSDVDVEGCRWPVVPSPREQALRVLLDEAKDHVEYQFRTIQDTEEKAGKIIRFNAVVAGLVFTGISLLLQAAPAQVVALDVVLLVGALGALVGSTGVASLAFTRPLIAVGLDAGRLEEALNYHLDPGSIRTGALVAYSQGLRHNYDRVVRPRGRRLAWSLALLVAGLILLAIETAMLLAMGGHP